MMYTVLLVISISMVLAAIAIGGYLYGVSRSCTSIREGLSDAANLMEMGQYDHDNSPILLSAASRLLDGNRYDQPQFMRRMILEFIGKEKDFLLEHMIEPT